MMRSSGRMVVLTMLTLSLSSMGSAAVFGASFTVYENDTAQLDRFQWLPNSSAKEPIIGGEYALQLQGAGAVLYDQAFRVSFDPVVVAANGTPGEDNATAGARSKYLFYRLPYEPAAERFVVAHGDRSLINTTIPDRICRPDGECPVYCRQQGREDADCEPRQTGTGVPVLAIVGVILMVAGAVVFLWYRRQEDADGADERSVQAPQRPHRGR